MIDHLLRDPKAVALINRLAPHGLQMSTVSDMEAFQGVGRGSNPVANAAALTALTNLVSVIDFTSVEAVRCA